MEYIDYFWHDYFWEIIYRSSNWDVQKLMCSCMVMPVSWIRSTCPQWIDNSKHGHREKILQYTIQYMGCGDPHQVQWPSAHPYLHREFCCSCPVLYAVFIFKRFWHATLSIAADFFVLSNVIAKYRLTTLSISPGGIICFKRYKGI